MPWIEAYKAKGTRRCRSSTAMLSGVQNAAFVEVLNGRRAAAVKAFASVLNLLDEAAGCIAHKTLDAGALESEGAMASVSTLSQTTPGRTRI